MTVKKIVKKGCDCLKQVQEELKPHNARVVRSMQVNLSNNTCGMSPPKLVLEKLDSKNRGKLLSVFCVYCPFCGKKYPDA